jgi:hypothetical protein
MRITSGALVVGLVVVACGPEVSVTRTSSYAALPDNCAVDIVEGDLSKLTATSSSPYEVVGAITFGESGHVQPFSKEHMEKIRPSVCRLGGTGVILGMSSSHVGTSTAYWVLRKRRQPEAPPAASPGLQL